MSVEKTEALRRDFREEYLECKIDRSDKFKSYNENRKNGILGIIQFSLKDDSPRQSSYFKDAPYPFLKVPLANLSLPYDLEIWYGCGDTRYEKRQTAKLAHNSHYLFGCVSLPLGYEPLERVTFNAYNHVFDLMSELAFPRLTRIWHFVPYINQKFDKRRENYHLFSLGRARAFNENNISSGLNDYPAATAIGTTDKNIHFYFLASRGIKTFLLENPAQVSAYHYPVPSGLMPPLFSRAAMLSQGAECQLFISGTSSVSGHESMYREDLEKQFELTIRNIEALVTSESVKSVNSHLSLKNPSVLKIYLKNNTHYELLKRLIRDHFHIDYPVMVLSADICRRELLLEIEGILKVKAPC